MASDSNICANPVLKELIGATVHNTLQMVGTITPDRTLYQGTMSGLFRITPR